MSLFCYEFLGPNSNLVYKAFHGSFFKYGLLADCLVYNRKAFNLELMLFRFLFHSSNQVLRSQVFVVFLLTLGIFFFLQALYIRNNWHIHFSLSLKINIVLSRISKFLLFLSFRDGQCPEYNRDEQAILAVGLAKAKPGVFIEAIQYLIVLATPVEVFNFP